MYSALADTNCDVDHLALFPQPNRDVDEAIDAADVIWVGGGSVANLLALWTAAWTAPLSERGSPGRCSVA